MKAHRTDGVSLVFGILFLIIALWWAVNGFIDIRLSRIGWLVPFGLIGLGLLGLVASLRGDRSTHVAGSELPAGSAGPGSFAPPAPATPAPATPAPATPDPATPAPATPDPATPASATAVPAPPAAAPSWPESPTWPQPDPEPRAGEAGPVERGDTTTDEEPDSPDQIRR
jgi:hypothetical protein